MAFESFSILCKEKHRFESLPYFLYCLPVFASTYHNHLNPLIKLQKRAIRAISMAGFLDHTEILFHQCKILKLEDQYKYSLACYLYRNQNLLTEFSRTQDTMPMYY